jgi:glycosyltransferase involved in cell wall biosynthesis
MHQFPGFGGMETIAATLAKEFNSRGHNVSFLSHKAGKGTSVMTALPQCVSCYKMPDTKKLVSDRNRRFLKEIVSQNKIDIILFRDSYAGIEKNVIGCGLRAKIITSEHNAPFFCHTEAHPENYTIKRRIIQIIKHFKFHLPYYYESRRKRFLYDYSDLYVLLSDRFYGEFKSVARLFDSRKLRAINNPLASELKPEKVDLDSKENLMVFAATLSAEKGAMRALKALKILHEAGNLPKGWRVEILGDGSEREKCEVFIKKYNLDFVEMRGYEANPQPFFARAKIFLFPSSREGFGNVLFEAQANGCVPIAFSSYSSVFDIIQHQKNGLLVDAFDIEKFAQGIQFLTMNSVQWRCMAQEAVKAVDQFNLKSIADEWVKLFQEVLK